VYVERRLVAQLDAPRAIAPRAWVLGVAAVQLTTVNGALSARLRTHVTGADEARIVELAGQGVVHVALGESPVEPTLPDLLVPREGACLRVALEGQILAEARLPRDPAPSSPRAYGHAFCRWLRAGSFEAGFDLTHFAEPQRGAKAERLLVGAMVPGQVASYAYSVT
jgi:hypothetical protein